MPRQTRGKLVFGVLLAGLCVFPAAAALAGTPKPLAGRLAELVKAFETRRGAVAGLSVVDISTGKHLAGSRAGELLIPASNQKILTSAFALRRLGGRFRFTTTVYRKGDDLVLVGSFDPTLGDPVLAEAAGIGIYSELDRWAAAIKEKVGPTVRGDLLLRCALKTDQLRCKHWPARQSQRHYAAPPAELNFHDNCFGVTFDIAGGRIVTDVKPRSRLIKVVSRLRVGPKHLWRLSASRDGSLLELRGTIKSSTSVPWLVAADNPPMLLGRVLADRLSRAGVKFAGQVRIVKPAEFPLRGASLLARTVTPMAVVLSRANKRSLNLAAECLFLRAGDGTFDGSSKIMTETLTRSFALAPDSLTVCDGGGLARGNRVTPAAMTKILVGLAGRKDMADFLTSLPISGTDGTLRKRLGGKGYRGRIRAKTGSITGVSSLSGYVLDPDGKETLAFSILCNGPGGASRARKLQDNICRLLVDSLTRSP